MVICIPHGFVSSGRLGAQDLTNDRHRPTKRQVQITVGIERWSLPKISNIRTATDNFRPGINLDLTENAAQPMLLLLCCNQKRLKLF